MAFHVGQQLVFYRHSMNTPRSDKVLVSKVGRKWVYFDNDRGRFDPDTLRVDGGQYSSPGRIYFSEEELQAELEASKAWRQFRDSVPYSPPEGWTADRIRALMAELQEPAR